METRRMLSKLSGVVQRPQATYAAYYDGTIPWVTTSELSVMMTIKQTASCVSPDAPTRLFGPPAISEGLAAGRRCMAQTVGRLGMLGVDAVVNQACCVFAKSTVAVTRFVCLRTARKARRTHRASIRRRTTQSEPVHIATRENSPSAGK